MIQKQMQSMLMQQPAMPHMMMVPFACATNKFDNTGKRQGGGAPQASVVCTGCHVRVHKLADCRTKDKVCDSCKQKEHLGGALSGHHRTVAVFVTEVERHVAPGVQRARTREAAVPAQVPDLPQLAGVGPS